MRDIARPLRRRRAAFLAWLISFSIAGLAAAQIGLPRPTPAPRPTPTAGGGQLVGDDSDIEPLAIQTVAGGQPAKFDRFVGVVNDVTKVPFSTCVSVRLQPRADRLHPTLSSTIEPVENATGCPSGEIRTCAAGERGDCGRYTVTIDSKPATPPATYRSDLVATCAICNPTQADVGGVRFAVAKARVDVTVTPGTPSTVTVPAGGRAIYSLVVQRSSYSGQITVSAQANDPLNVIVEVAPRLIPASADPNARHVVVVTANTAPDTLANTYPISVAVALAPDVMADVTTPPLTLVVTPAPAQPTLTVSIDPKSLEARRSTCAQFEVTVKHANFPANFNGMAALTLLPTTPPLGAGLNAFFTPPNVPIVGSTGQTTSILRIGVAPTAGMQTYTLPVRATTTMGTQTISDTENAGLLVLAVAPRIAVTSNVLASPPLNAAGSFTFQLMLQRGRQPNCPPTPIESVELVTGVFNDFIPVFTQPGSTDAAQLQVVVAPQPTPGPRDVVISGLPADADKYEIVPTTVTVVIADPPQPPPTGSNLTVGPTSLSYSATAGGPSPAARVLSIGSTGGVLNWTASDNAPWLTVSPATGTTGSNANAIVNVAGLAAGTYTATIAVSSPGVPSVSVPVTLTLTAPPPPLAGLVVSPASLSFTAPQGGPAPAPQVLSIASSGAPLNWTVTDNAAFVNETPASGTTPGATNVSINVGGLAAGSYGATITVSAPGVPSRTVPVSLTVTAVGPGTPVVNGFNPVSGGPGTQIEVIGANFTGVTQVQFNTAPASFQPSDSGRLFATVPPGATTGPIRVTNASGTGASFTPFTVTSGSAPSISGFSPGSGRPGDRITIQGANFTDPAQVFFNNTPSPFVLFAGPNFLSAEVPSGATTGPIRVTTGAGSATSAQSFVVTQ